MLAYIEDSSYICRANKSIGGGKTPMGFHWELFFFAKTYYCSFIL